MQNSPQDLRKKLYGRGAEQDVGKFLKKRGYRILAHNYVTPFGEADLVAQSRDGYTCFVEVKARRTDTFGSAPEAVTYGKQLRYRRIAAFWCAALKREVPVRFDVAAVSEDGIEYFEDAFQ